MYRQLLPAILLASLSNTLTASEKKAITTEPARRPIREILARPRVQDVHDVCDFTHNTDEAIACTTCTAGACCCACGNGSVGAVLCYTGALFDLRDTLVNKGYIGEKQKKTQ